MHHKKYILFILSILNIAANGFILATSFLLSSKIDDYYASWNVPYSWLMLAPTVIMGICFLGGVIWLVLKRQMWANLPIAVPLILTILFSFVSDSFLKTPAMRQLDETNRKNIECIMQFQREHPGEDSTGRCPF